MIKQLTLDYEVQKQSIVFCLKNTFAEYRKITNELFNYAGFNDDGKFYVLEGYEERNAKTQELEKEMIRLIFKLDELKNEMKERGTDNAN